MCSSDLCSFYCHSASTVALNDAYGSGTSSVTLEDLAEADFALVAGANPASNHPRLITQLVALRRRGGRVVVVNPLRELGLTRFRIPSDWRSLLFGSTVSDLYLQPHIGSDVALYQALLKGVIEAGALDRVFIAEHTTGFEEVRASVEATAWETLIEACGVPRAEIDRAVRMLCEAKRGIFLWAMGLTHHANGVDNVAALANLAMATGNLGRLQARFRNHTVALFAKHGMTNLFYWTPLAGQKNADDTLVYLLAHKDADAAKASFAAFRTDPVWVAARDASEKEAGGSLTVKDGVKSEFLKAVDFSPTR